MINVYFSLNYNQTVKKIIDTKKTTIIDLQFFI